MEIRFMPEVDKEEKIFGFQILFNEYAIDIYLCFQTFKLGIFRNKGECWGILLGFFRIEGTNLNMEWWQYETINSEWQSQIDEGR